MLFAPKDIRFIPPYNSSSNAPATEELLLRFPVKVIPFSRSCSAQAHTIIPILSAAPSALPLTGISLRVEAADTDGGGSTGAFTELSTGCPVVARPRPQHPCSTQCLWRGWVPLEEPAGEKHCWCSAPECRAGRAGAGKDAHANVVLSTCSAMWIQECNLLAILR